MSFTSGDKIFLDTNILCYLYDNRDLEKQSAAQRLFQNLLASGNIQISTQVLQEFCSVCISRIHIPKAKVYEYAELLARLPVHLNDAAAILKALKISEEARLSFWDSLIIAAAKESGCNILLSEDLNDGQNVHGVKIVNPFKR